MKAIFALLLALMLPLQSYAAAPRCESPAGHGLAAAHEHCAHQAPAPSRQHHACCVDCCMAALVGAAFNWSAPRADTPELYLSPPRAPVTFYLDRLDRPPRHMT